MEMRSTNIRSVVVASDFAGFDLKEAVKGHLVDRGWQVHDLTCDLENLPMYHRAGFMLGAKLAEGEFVKALGFCGTGMGIHIAASKCPRVHAAVAESVPAARRAAAANGCNLLAMGGFWTGPRLGMAMAQAFLETSFGQGYEQWPGFYEYHLVGFEECEHFDYEHYRANGFQVADPSVPHLGPQPIGFAL